MQGKRADGTWADPQGGWTEGSAWVYTWAVMHNLGGLLELMGGHNVHSHEPSHHYGYLYDCSGRPWKTQEKVRAIAAAEYPNAPTGLDGDDDCGQMSAGYLSTASAFTR